MNIENARLATRHEDWYTKSIAVAIRFTGTHTVLRGTKIVKDRRFHLVTSASGIKATVYWSDEGFKEIKLI